MIDNLICAILFILLFTYLLYWSIKKRNKKQIIASVIFLVLSLTYGSIVVLAMSYKEPEIEYQYDIESKSSAMDADINAPDITLPDYEYREDKNAIGFGMDGILGNKEEKSIMESVIDTLE